MKPGTFLALIYTQVLDNIGDEDTRIQFNTELLAPLDGVEPSESAERARVAAEMELFSRAASTL